MRRTQREGIMKEGLLVFFSSAGKTGADFPLFGWVDMTHFFFSLNKEKLKGDCELGESLCTQK